MTFFVHLKPEKFKIIICLGAKIQEFLEWGDKKKNKKKKQLLICVDNNRMSTEDNI